MLLHAFAFQGESHSPSGGIRAAESVGFSDGEQKHETGRSCGDQRKLGVHLQIMGKGCCLLGGNICARIKLMLLIGRMTAL